MLNELERIRAKFLQKNIHKAIEAVDRVFTANNIHYWLASGSLLGIIRDEQPVPDDTDLDLDVVTDAPEFVYNILEQNGFHIWYYFCNSNHRKILIRAEKFFVGIDIQFLQKIDNSLVYISPRELPKGILRTHPQQHEILGLFLPKDIAEISRKSFRGVSFNIPKDYNQYLEIWYGKKWQIPIQKEDYQKEVYAISLTEQKDPDCNPRYIPNEYVYHCEHSSSTIAASTVGKTFALGILVFNPEDDPIHLEQIQNCLQSLCLAAESCVTQVELVIGINISENPINGSKGMATQTKNFIESLERKYAFVCSILLDYKDSMIAKGYNILLKHLYNQTNADYISVFADDYIVPYYWFNKVLSEFAKYGDADFIMPSTSFVTHKNLLVPLKIREHWQPNINQQTGVLNGIHTGITIEEATEIANDCQGYRTIRFVPSVSFETTVFTRNYVERFGFLDDQYYSLFFNQEYVNDAVAKGAIGYISRKSFVFHYGKGGTGTVHKKTGDEKFSGSPVEFYLKRDVDYYNQKHGTDVKYWWQDKNHLLERSFRFDEQVQLLQDYDYQDIRREIIKTSGAIGLLKEIVKQWRIYPFLRRLKKLLKRERT